VEQAQFAARYLSFLLLFLSQNTDVEQINVIAHSAGSRVLSRALTDLSLVSGFGPDREENLKKHKIGNIVFAGGDVSKDVMGVYIEYGMIEVASKVIIYFSNTDKALGLSNWLWKENRIGNLDIDQTKMTDYTVDYLKSMTQLELVDATGTPGSNKQHGHVYFLTSQWVSSDLMLYLRTNFSPDKRGLIRDESDLYWKFPKDYRTKSTYKKLKDRIPGASMIPGASIIEDTLKLD
jgi:esterase/lipase superfamily enzyme